MRFLIYTILLTLLVSFAPVKAMAEVEDGTVVPASVILPLMSWVEMQTGVRVPNLPPVIASNEKFSQIIRVLGRSGGRPKALYTAGTIILDSDEWDPEDSTQLSLLLHELVHHAQSQMRSGSWACAQEKEYQAYTLQNKWLQEKEHTSFINVAWIKRLSQCPGGSSSISLASNP